MKMKRYILTAFAALFALVAWAQTQEKGKPRFDPQLFQRHMEAELTRQSGLTPEEAKVFFPLYEEMKEKQRCIGMQIRQLMNQENLDDAACSYNIAQIKKLQLETNEIEQTYYKRFVEIVPACKVFKIMKAEDDFHRRMVQGQHYQRRSGKQRGNK